MCELDLDLDVDIIGDIYSDVKQSSHYQLQNIADILDQEPDNINNIGDVTWSDVELMMTVMSPPDVLEWVWPADDTGMGGAALVGPATCKYL